MLSSCVCPPFPTLVHLYVFISVSVPRFPSVWNLFCKLLSLVAVATDLPKATQGSKVGSQLERVVHHEGEVPGGGNMKHLVTLHPQSGSEECWCPAGFLHLSCLSGPVYWIVLHRKPCSNTQEVCLLGDS